MSNAATSRIAADPKYRELVQKRDQLSWTLSACVMVLYFGFILLVALAPEFLTQTISESSVIPLGIPIGVAVIVGSIVLTAIYVYQANRTFDPIIENIMKDVSK